MAWFSAFFKRKKRISFVDLSGKSFSDEEYNRIRREQEAYAMQLLQKVGKGGQDSLDADEKAFLDAYSQSNYLD